MAQPPFKAFALVGVAYLLALVAAVGAGMALTFAHPMLKVAVGTVAGTAVVFAFSRAFDNTSLYDPYWSVAPIAAAVYLFAGPGDGGARGLLLVVLIAVWGWRLTLNWARSWRGLQHEDWRYTDIRKVTGRGYWWASAFGLHLFPTVVVFLGLLPTHAAFVSSEPLGVLDALAAAVTLAAIALETVADEQLKRFRTRPTASVCDVGIWRYSRHPNYLGEISFWAGLWLFGVRCGTPWWTAVGPLSMLGLFLFASIPLMERHLAVHRPGYEDHQRRTSMLLPWPPKS